MVVPWNRRTPYEDDEVNAGGGRKKHKSGPRAGYPTSSFTYTVNGGGVVQFVSTSVGGDGTPANLLYEWTFGDGTSSSEGPGAAHTYATDGTYPVTLRVTDPATGYTAMSTQYINVTAPPTTPAPLTAVLTLSATSTTPGTMTVLVDGRGSYPATQITSYLYEWVGGGPFGTAPLATSAYFATSGDHPAEGGTYTMRLTVGDARGGTATTTATVTIPAAPVRVPDLIGELVADFVVASMDTLNDGTEEVLRTMFDASTSRPARDADGNAIPIVAYQWTLPDKPEIGPWIDRIFGTPDPLNRVTMTTRSTEFDQPGLSGTVTLTVTDQAGNTATVSKLIDFTIAQVPADAGPKADFLVSERDPDNPLSYTLYDTSSTGVYGIDTWTWTYQDVNLPGLPPVEVATVNGPYGNAQDVTFPGRGMYLVTLTVRKTQTAPNGTVHEYEDTKTEYVAVVVLLPPTDPAPLQPPPTGTPADGGGDTGEPTFTVTIDEANGTITFTDTTPNDGSFPPETHWIFSGVREGIGGAGLPDPTLSTDGRAATFQLDELEAAGYGGLAAVLQRRDPSNSDPDHVREAGTVVALPNNPNAPLEDPNGDLDGDGYGDNRKPQAYFVDYTNEGDEPGCVRLYDNSLRGAPDRPIASFQWQAKADAVTGEKTKTGRYTQWCFGEPGTYEVTLTVTDTRGGTDSTTRTVTTAGRARDYPVAQFEYSEDGNSETPRALPSPSSVMVFTSTSLSRPDGTDPIISYTWRVLIPDNVAKPVAGQGNGATPGQEYTLPETGETARYEIETQTKARWVVTLTVATQGGARDTTSQVIEVPGNGSVEGGPTAAFEWEKRPVPNNRTVTFTNKSRRGLGADPLKILVYYWTFGDGTWSTQTNPVHEFPDENETYRVTLVVAQVRVGTIVDGEGVTKAGDIPVDMETQVVDTDGLRNGPIPDMGHATSEFANYEIEVTDKSRYDPQQAVYYTVDSPGGDPLEPYWSLAYWEYKWATDRKRFFPDPDSTVEEFRDFAYAQYGSVPPGWYSGGDPGSFFLQFPKPDKREDYDPKKQVTVRVKDAYDNWGEKTFDVTVLDCRPAYGLEVIPVNDGNDLHWRIEDKTRVSYNSKEAGRIDQAKYFLNATFNGIPDPSLAPRVENGPTNFEFFFPRAGGVWQFDVEWKDDADEKRMIRTPPINIPLA